MGQFMTDEGAMTPVTFRGADEGELRNKMLSWLEAERVKAGVTAEKIAQRKIEREAARKAKAARAALGEGK
jgi:hypothetical protein